MSEIVLLRRTRLVVAALAFFLEFSCSNASKTAVSREQVLGELQKDKPALHLRVLKSLPDVSLPELEDHFVRRAVHNPWLFGHLIARYGTEKLPGILHGTYSNSDSNK